MLDSTLTLRMWAEASYIINQRKAQRTAYRHWCEIVKKNEYTYPAVQLNFSVRYLRSPVLSWRFQTARAKQHLQFRKKLANSICQRIQNRAFKIWLLKFFGSRHHASTELAASMRWTKVFKSTAIHVWKQNARNEAVLRMLCGKALVRFKRYALKVSFHKWCKSLHETFLLRRSLISKKKDHLVFVAWRTSIDYRTYEMRRCLHVAGIIRRNAIRNTLCCIVWAWHELKSNTEKVNLENWMHSILSMKFELISSAFRTWATRILVKLRLKLIQTGFQKRRVGEYFHVWISIATSEKKQRRKFQNLLKIAQSHFRMTFSRPLLEFCMELWREESCWLAHNRIAETNLSAIAQKIREKLRHVFYEWKYVTATKRRQRIATARVFKSHDNRLQAAACRTWKSNILASRRTRQICSKIKELSTKRQIASSVYNWAHQSVRQRRLTHIWSTLTLRRKYLSLARYWGLLCMMCQANASTTRVARRVGNRVCHLLLSNMWREWTAWALWCRKLDRASSQADVRTRRRIISASFAGMTQGIAQRRIKLEAIMYVATRGVAGLLSSTFVSWKEHHKWRRSLTRAAAAAALKHQTRLVSAVFAALFGREDVRTRRRLILSRCDSIAGKFTWLRMAYYAWMESCDQRRRVSHTAARVVRRWRSGILNRAWESWACARACRRRWHQQLHRALLSRRHYRLVASFSCWQRWRFIHSKATVTAARVARHAVSAAWTAMSSHSSTMRLRRKAAADLEAQRCTAALVRAVAAWRSAVADDLDCFQSGGGCAGSEAAVIAARTVLELWRIMRLGPSEYTGITIREGLDSDLCLAGWWVQRKRAVGEQSLWAACVRAVQRSKLLATSSAAAGRALDGWRREVRRLKMRREERRRLSDALQAWRLGGAVYGSFGPTALAHARCLASIATPVFGGNGPNGAVPGGR